MQDGSDRGNWAGGNATEEYKGTLGTFHSIFL